MALNFPTNPTDLQQYTDPNNIVWEYSATKGVWNKLRSDIEKQFSGAKIYFTTIKSLSSTLTAIQFGASEFDTETYFDSLTNPSRLTIRRSGFYRLNLLAVTGPEGNGAAYTMSVKKNGSLTLSTSTAGPNQFVTFDEIYQLSSGDYIEFYAKENDAVGTLLTDSFFEINRIGFSVGSSFSAQTAFSGVKTILTSNVNLSSTPTTINWNTTEYNLNATINGQVYWENTAPSDIVIKTPGYYRVKGEFNAGSSGTENSYLVDLKIDSVTFHSSSLSSNETIIIDETVQLATNSTLQIYVKNNDSVGDILSDSYLQVIREGV